MSLLYTAVRPANDGGLRLIPSLPNATVEIQSSGGAWLRVPKDDGGYLFTVWNLTEGTYHVRARVEGGEWTTTDVQAHSGGDSEYRIPVTAAPVEAPFPWKWAALGTAAVVGAVLLFSDSPRPNPRRRHRR